MSAKMGPDMSKMGKHGAWEDGELEEAMQLDKFTALALDYPSAEVGRIEGGAEPGPRLPPRFAARVRLSQLSSNGFQAGHLEEASRESEGRDNIPLVLDALPPKGSCGAEEFPVPFFRCGAVLVPRLANARDLAVLGELHIALRAPHHRTLRVNSRPTAFGLQTGRGGF